MHLEAVFIRDWRYVPGGDDRTHLEAMIMQFGGRKQARLQMHLEAEIEGVWRP